MDKSPHIFLNRGDAGMLLGAELIKKGIKADLIAAIPRGGIPVAAEIGKMIHLPVQLAYVKKIGHPSNPELAIGAVTVENILLDKRYAHLQVFANLQAAAIRRRIEKQRIQLGHVLNRQMACNRDIILVDDGIATGLTIKLAIKEYRSWGAKSITVAVPVSSEAAVNELEKETDELICLIRTTYFSGVGAYYKDFPQLTDEEVAAELLD